jgi:FemAB-related protein (PEP-CTERM system-associated)
MVTVSAEYDPADWDRFVSAHDAATFYHRERWRRVFERAFRHRTEYLIARDEQGVAGVLPLVEFRSRLFGRFMVSLPFVNYGGVLARDDRAARALVDRAASLAAAHGLRHVELRHTAPRFGGMPCKQHKVGMLLALEGDTAAAWTALDRKVRNQIRKAQKSELTAEEGGAELLGAFYQVFAANMRDLGTPVYSRRFFSEVLAAFPAEARIVAVRHLGAPIAAGIVLRHGAVCELPWASSLRAYRTSCPNNLLYWTAITAAIEHGCTTFDFGRSTPGEGTFQFKSQWGAQPVPLHWEYPWLADSRVPDLTTKNPKYALAIEMWKRVPVTVATLIGPSIVRCIP